jgi:hypothetical protein
MSAIQIAKPVSQIAEAAGQVWAKTLAALASVFPLAGLAFLVRLVACVRALFPDVQDDELARAVTFAWEGKRSIQKSEGLFLTTVPAALRHFRTTATAPPGGRREPARDSGALEGARRILSKCLGALRDRGGAFELHAAACGTLLESPALSSCEAFAEGVSAVYEAAGTIQFAIEQTAIEALDQEQRRVIDRYIDVEVVRNGFSPDKQTADQIAGLRLQLLRRHACDEFELPRLDLYYA